MQKTHTQIPENEASLCGCELWNNNNINVNKMLLEEFYLQFFFLL